MADWGGGGLALAFWIGATKYAVLLVQGNCDSTVISLWSHRVAPFQQRLAFLLHCFSFHLVDAADKTLTHLVESINCADRVHLKQEIRKITSRGRGRKRSSIRQKIKS